jgi:hypothetical protein
VTCPCHTAGDAVTLSTRECKPWEKEECMASCWGAEEGGGREEDVFLKGRQEDLFIKGSRTSMAPRRTRRAPSSAELNKL